MDVSPFYSNLKAALNHPHFIRDGGILGFACQHLYVLKELNRDAPLLLKGADREVFSVARSLDLEVTVEPILKVYDYREGCDEEDPLNSERRCLTGPALVGVTIKCNGRNTLKRSWSWMMLVTFIGVSR